MEKNNRQPIKYLSIDEFVAMGGLLALNREFLHPVGLALTVEQGKDGKRLKAIVDMRETPEKMLFAQEYEREYIEKKLHTWQEFTQKQHARRKKKLKILQQPEDRIYTSNIYERTQEKKKKNNI